MTQKEFLEKIASALLEQATIINVFKADTSLIVNCSDQSSFFINIIKSQFSYIHDDSCNNIVNEYIDTHAKEDFAKDLLSMTQDHPAFFLYFMLFMKLEELEIIDEGLFLHIMDHIAFCEQDFDHFLLQLLLHYNIGKQ